MRRGFLRVETYALAARLSQVVEGKQKPGKRSAWSIAREADRVPGHAPHVAHPRPPLLLHGQHAVAAVSQLAEDVIQAKVQHLLDTGAKLKVRKDQQLVVSGVISYPEARLKTEGDGDLYREYRRWRTRVLRFLRRRLKASLKTVLEHRDESTLHLHFLATPDVLAGELDLANLHPGIRASKECGPRGSVPFKVRRDAWRRGMRALQLDFFHQVSFWFGHTLRNARKQKLTREQFQAQKQQLKALGEAGQHAAELLKAADRERQEARAERARMLEDLLAERKAQRATLAAALTGVDEARRRLEVALEIASRVGITLPPEVALALEDASRLVDPA